MIKKSVHSGVSQGTCAEPAWSRTPGSDQGPGGSDHKGEAQGHCETLFRSAGFFPLFFYVQIGGAGGSLLLDGDGG